MVRLLLACISVVAVACSHDYTFEARVYYEASATGALEHDGAAIPTERTETGGTVAVLIRVFDAYDDTRDVELAITARDEAGAQTDVEVISAAVCDRFCGGDPYCGSRPRHGLVNLGLSADGQLRADTILTCEYDDDTTHTGGP